MKELMAVVVFVIALFAVLIAWSSHQASKCPEGTVFDIRSNICVYGVKP